MQRTRNLAKTGSNGSWPATCPLIAKAQLSVRSTCVRHLARSLVGLVAALICSGSKVIAFALHGWKVWSYEFALFGPAPAVMPLTHLPSHEAWEAPLEWATWLAFLVSFWVSTHGKMAASEYRLAIVLKCGTTSAPRSLSDP